MTYSYQKAGVNLGSADKFIGRLKKLLNPLRSADDLSGIGGFSGLFRLPVGYQNPVLVAATDGVGTKLKLACEHNLFQGIGQDLVAMCANDLICCGARPLFFLDYLATSELKSDIALEIAESILQACQVHEMSLLGGETAELPDMLPPGGYELAGFCLGIVEESKILGPARTEPGDVILGLPSSGLHSNGYSLIRKILDGERLDLTEVYPGMEQPLLYELLKPTELYYRQVEPIYDHLRALAHITGGGLPENLPRAFQPSLKLVIDRNSLPRSPILELFRVKGDLSQPEIDRTFNQGIGMALIVSPAKLDLVKRHFEALGAVYFELGELEPREEHEPSLTFRV